MHSLHQHLENILAIDATTLYVIGGLCAVACYFIKDYLATPPLVILLYPFIFLLSVLTQYAFILMEIYPSNKLDLWLMWTIIASIVGTIFGTSLVAAVAVWRYR